MNYCTNIKWNGIIRAYIRTSAAMFAFLAHLLWSLLSIFSCISSTQTYHGECINWRKRDTKANIFFYGLVIFTLRHNFNGRSNWVDSVADFHNGIVVTARAASVITAEKCVVFRDAFSPGIFPHKEKCRPERDRRVINSYKTRCYNMKDALNILLLSCTGCMELTPFILLISP